MVGEGVLLECLADPSIEEVLLVSRKPYGTAFAKVKECLVADFFTLEGVMAELTGYDACFFCAGVSSAGMKEAEYTRITYDTTLHFAEVLAELNPAMVFEYVSGQQTDSSETGRVMWARVKGRTENALSRLGFQAVYNLRPGLMRPTPGQQKTKWYYQAIGGLYPVLRLVLPNHVSTLQQVARAMIRVAIEGYAKTVLEVKDINALGAV
jgi:uncharacterized protein YbjT (DUF2867 family)